MNSKNCQDNFGNNFQIKIDENTSLNLFSNELSQLYRQCNLIFLPENFKYYDINNGKLLQTDQDLKDAECIRMMIIPIKCESIISNYLVHNQPNNYYQNY